MQNRVEVCRGLVQDIEALGQRWQDWRRGELRQHRAVQLLCGTCEPYLEPEITVGREEFNVAGETMICLHPGCGGFVRGLIRCDTHVFWSPQCQCPTCGQRYTIRDH